MPAPVAWFAENQPVTSIVDTMRALFAQEPVGTDIWVALAWLVGILVVAYGVAVAIYRRRIRRPLSGLALLGFGCPLTAGARPCPSTPGLLRRRSSAGGGAAARISSASARRSTPACASRTPPPSWTKRACRPRSRAVDRRVRATPTGCRGPARRAGSASFAAAATKRRSSEIFMGFPSRRHPSVKG